MAHPEAAVAFHLTPFRAVRTIILLQLGPEVAAILRFFAERRYKSSLVNDTSGRIKMISSPRSRLSFDSATKKWAYHRQSTQIWNPIYLALVFLVSVINPPRTMVEQFGAENVSANVASGDRRHRIAADIYILLPGTTLSIFCKISRETSFSELMSGTTSSCSATFLNSIVGLDCESDVVDNPAPVVHVAQRCLPGPESPFRLR